MAYVFDPLVFEGLVPSGGSGGGSSPAVTQFVEYHVVTNGEAGANQLTLMATPHTANKVILDIISGTPQQYSVDYTVTGNVLSWSGLGLQGQISAGDVLRILYWI